MQIRPKFQTVLRVPEEDIDTQVAANQTALTKCTVPVYTAGVLGAFGQVCTIDPYTLSYLFSEMIRDVNVSPDTNKI